MTEAEERAAFQAQLAKMPEWAPEFEAHRPWVEKLLRDMYQAGRASMQAEAPQATKDAEDAALRNALVLAEAALADIGDADREPGDDVAWCEARAAQALPVVRAALAACKSQGEQERTREQLARDLQTNQEIDAMVEKMKGQP